MLLLYLKRATADRMREAHLERGPIPKAAGNMATSLTRILAKVSVRQSATKDRAEGPRRAPGIQCRYLP